MDDLNSLSISDLRNLNKEQAKELFVKLGLTIPKHRDLEYLRATLRLKKINLAQEHTYENHLADKFNTALQNFDKESTHKTEDNFTDEDNDSYETIDFSPTTRPKVNMANERIPFATPSNFGGNVSENVEMFMNRFEKAATLNNWNDNHKKAYLSLYVTDLAARRLAMLEKQDPAANWATLKSKFTLPYLFGH